MNFIVSLINDKEENVDWPRDCLWNESISLQRHKHSIFKYNEKKPKRICFIILWTQYFLYASSILTSNYEYSFPFVLFSSSTIGVIFGPTQHFGKGPNLQKKKFKTKAIITVLTYQIHLCNTIRHLPRQGPQLPTSTHLKIS